MPCPRSYIALGLLALAAPSISKPVVMFANDQSPAATLHEEHPKYADGTFETDQSALEVVHQESPALATRILELARRQATGTNDTSVGSQTPIQPATSTAVVAATTPTLSPSVVVQTSTASVPTLSSTVVEVVVTTSVAGTSPTQVVVTMTTTAAPVATTTPDNVQSSASPAASSSPDASSPAAQMSSPAPSPEATQSPLITVVTPPGGTPTTITTFVGGPGAAAPSANAKSTSGGAAHSGTLRDAAGLLRPDAYWVGVAGVGAAFVMGMVA